jgi:hypothetical protein
LEGVPGLGPHDCATGLTLEPRRQHEAALCIKTRGGRMTGWIGGSWRARPELRRQDERHTQVSIKNAGA